MTSIRAQVAALQNEREQAEREPLDIARPDSFDPLTDPGVGRPAWFAQELFGRGEYVLVAAGWKVGKSFVAYRMGLDAVFGQPLLDRHDVPLGLRVLAIQAEMPASETLRRFRRLSLGAGIRLEDVQTAVAEGRLVVYSRLGIDLARETHRGWLHRTVRDGCFDLVLLDSIVACFPGVPVGDNGEARRLCALTFDPLTSEGASLVVLHHKRKGRPGESDAGRDAILGAQAWAASASRVFTLDRAADCPEDADNGRHNAFRVRLVGQGAWGPGGDCEALLRVSDDANDTMTYVERLDADPKRPRAGGSLQTAAALWLSRYVRRQGRCPWRQARAMACADPKDDGGGFAARTVERARQQAEAQGWIESVPGDGHGRAVDLVPGEADPEGPP